MSSDPFPSLDLVARALEGATASPRNLRMIGVLPDHERRAAPVSPPTTVEAMTAGTAATTLATTQLTESTPLPPNAV
jgi:hypothetical protein